MRLSPAADNGEGAALRGSARTLSVFAMVGLAATLLYVLLANAFFAAGLFSASSASLAAYLVCAVFSYAGHKYLTFASDRAHALELPRFALLTASGALLSLALPLLLHDAAGLPAWLAFMAIALAIPVINYAVMQLWVFGTTSETGALVRGQLLFAAAIAGVSALSAANMLVWGTVPDTSYLLTVLDQMHAGGQLYTDIRELNPVFSIWLYLPAWQVARLSGVTPEIAVHLYTLGICLAGSAGAMWIARAGNLVTMREALAGTVLLYALTVLLPGNSFTERDHLGAVAALPLFALAAWRIASRGPAPRWPHVLAGAVGAAVLVMVKPYYAVVVIAAAAAIAIERRSIRAFVLPEYLISAALFLAYFAVFFGLYGVYFETLLPLLRDTYMAASRPPAELLVLALPGLCALAAALLLNRGRADPVTWMLALCALAAWVPFVLQGKGWSYHSYAAVLLTAVALISAARLRMPAGRAATVGMAVVVLGVIAVTHWRFVRSEIPDAGFVAAIEAASDNPAVAMIGADIADSHPLTRMVGGTWVEPYCSDWLLSYALRRRMDPAAGPDTVARMQALESSYIDEKAARLLADPPDILLVSEGTRATGELLRSGRFDGLLSGYERIAASNGLAAYRRAR